MTETKRILLTGHQGYLGSVLVPILWDAGHDVVGLDNGYFHDCVLGQNPIDPPGLRVDLRDVTTEHLEGFDAVIHLAALSGDPVRSLVPTVVDDVNRAASVRLARLAKDAGVPRFLYASSCAVYGPSGDAVVDEDSPLRPQEPAAVSKARVEEAVAELADSGFSAVFLRMATAFGFSPRMRADTALNRLVGHAVLSGAVPTPRDGSARCSLVHVRDIARAFTACAAGPDPAASCRAYNIGAAANTVTADAVTAAVLGVVPDSAPLVTDEFRPELGCSSIAFGRAEVELGFEARWSIADGVAELYGEYTANVLSGHEFEHTFARLRRLQYLRGQGALDETMRRVHEAA